MSVGHNGEAAYVGMARLLNERNLEPEFFPSFCQQIADGETYINLARSIGVYPSVLKIWIATDEKRQELYQQAIDTREELRREAIRKNVYDIAINVVEKPTETATLRAAEMMLNPKTTGVSLNAEGGKITIIHSSE